MKLARVCLASLVILVVVDGQNALAQVRRRSQTVLFPPTGNFQNPGARSFGLGGAFVGLADDASASELNPAGLTQLRRPEVTVEYRRLQSTIPVNYPNSVVAGPFECTFLGAAGDPCTDSFKKPTDSLAFVSMIVPSGRSLTYAFYRHELDRERVSLLRPALDFPENFQAPGTSEELERRITRTGLALAYAFSEKLSAGVTVNLNSMTQSFRAVEYFTDYALGGAAGGPPSVLSFLQENHIESQKLGGTVGLYWRPVRPVSLGVSYSSRVQFDERGLRNLCVANAATGLPRCGFTDGAPDPNNLYAIDELGSIFALPARLGGSLAVRPAGWLVLIGEADRVSYSDNDHDLDRFDSDGNLVGFDRLSARDVWELHAGTEVVLAFSRRGLLAVRGGYWRDPDHSFRYLGCRALAGKQCESDSLFPETHAPTGPADHFAGGLGVAWAWGQVDVGYDWNRQNRSGTLALSVVVRGK